MGIVHINRTLGKMSAPTSNMAGQRRFVSNVSFITNALSPWPCRQRALEQKNNKLR